MSRGLRPFLSGILLCIARSCAPGHGLQAWMLSTPCSANLGAVRMGHRALGFSCRTPYPAWLTLSLPPCRLPRLERHLQRPRLQLERRYMCRRRHHPHAVSSMLCCAVLCCDVL